MPKYDVCFSLPFLYGDIEAKNEEEAIEKAKQLCLDELQDCGSEDVLFIDVGASEIK